MKIYYVGIYLNSRCNLNVNSIYGISDKCQIFLKKQDIYISPFHRISFDYDQFWKELGGIKEVMSGLSYL